MSWNRNNPINRHAAICGRRGVPFVLLVASVTLAVLCGLALWWAWRSRANATRQERRPQRSEAIPDAGAERPRRPAVASAKEESEEPRSNVPPEQRVMHTNLYGYVINRPSTKVVITNRTDDADRPLEEQVFSNSADQKIAALLLLKPGEMLVGDPSTLFGRGFVRAFLKSIETPIIVEEGDDEVTAELKRAVRESKIEIKARYDAGEDIGELMSKECQELQALGLYREELKDQVAKFARDKSLSEDDMKDFVAAANRMLEERGGQPLQMPRFAARRFMLERRRREMSSGDGDQNE